jgi:hypothetical protein
VRLGYAIFAVAGLTFLASACSPVTRLVAQTRQLPALFRVRTGDGSVPALATRLIIGVNLMADGLQQVVDR